MRSIVGELILAIVIALCSCITMQMEVLAQAAAPSPSLIELSTDKWSQYTFEQGRFRIRFPGKPEEEASSLDVHYISYSGLLTYRVSYSDEPELSGSLESANKYLEEMRDASELITKASNAQIVTQKPVTIDGYPGHFTYVKTAKGWVRDLQIVVGKRVYTIVVEGRQEAANKVDEKNDFERVAMAFMNSFELISP